MKSRVILFVNLRKIILVILECYFSVASGCIDLGQKNLRTQQELQIQEGITCIINHLNNLITFHKINIQGRLEIINDSPDPLIFSYDSLTVEPNGQLYVQQSLNSGKIILYQNGNEECLQNEASQGNIFIDSFPLMKVSLLQDAIVNQKFIAVQNPSYFQVGQKLIIVDPNYYLKDEIHTILTISSDVIWIENPLQNSYIIYKGYNSSFLNPYIVSYSEGGIAFVNTCLSGYVEKVIGATFINPRGIFLSGNNVEYSLFKFESNYYNLEGIYSYDYPIRLQFNLKFTRNLLINLTNVQIITTDNSLSFNKNFFYKMINTTLPQKNVFISNKFVESMIFIIPQNNNDPLVFKKTHFLHSNILIMNQEDQDIFFVQNTYIINQSQIRFMNNLNSLTINNSYLIEIFLELQQIFITSQLNITNNYISNFYPHDCIIYLQENKKFLNIVIGENVITGKFKHFISEFNFNNNQRMISKNQNEIIYLVYLDNNKFNLMNQQNDLIPPSQSFLLLSNMMVYINEAGKQTNSLVSIESFNLNIPYLQKPFKFFLSHDVYLTPSHPSYYKLINHIFSFDYRSGYLQCIHTDFLSEDCSLINPQQSTQIFKNNTHYLSFKIQEDSEYLELEVFDLIISQADRYESDSSGQYRVVINAPNRAIKSMKISKYQYPQDLLLQFIREEESFDHLEDEVKFTKQNHLNELDITWSTITGGMAAYQIKISYCSKNELYEQGVCVGRCSKIQRGFVCIQDCIQGYLIEDETVNQCKICDKNSDKCLEDGKSLTCKDGYKLDKFKCIEMCGQNKFYKGNECLFCKNECQLCENEQSCSSFNKNTIKDSCSQGNFFTENECLPCNITCKSCIGNDLFQCLECSAGYLRKNGQCIQL